MSDKNSSATSTPQDERIRNITFMLYDDSATPNWKDLIVEDHIPYMYIYHDRDKNPTGEPKKPHYHVILCFEGKKSPKQLQYYADRYGAANGQYQPVASIRAMARYLTHMDNPDKEPYDSGEVVSCAIDYNAIIGMASDKYKAIMEMVDFCESENIISFGELFIYSKIHRFDWFKCLCDSSTMVMKEYLKSKAWAMEHNIENRFAMNIDPDTGEVLEGD